MTKEGDIRYVSIQISPTEYPGRDALLVSAIDITERLEAEQQLIQASKMATLGEMATGLAHELNQPLTVIQTISSFFMRKIGKAQRIDDTTFEDMASGISEQVERAAKIVNHVREFGRRSALALEPVPLNRVLAKAFDLFSQQLQLRHIEVHWDLAPSIPPIMAEPNRLEQVFINLLINARDAIEEHTAPDSERRITLRTFREGDLVCVSISDTGPGIPEAIVEKLFEPFFTTKEVGKGTGLGLSISYSIVKDYAGDIRVEANEGSGACFTLLFPPAQ